MAFNPGSYTPAQLYQMGTGYTPTGQTANPSTGTGVGYAPPAPPVNPQGTGSGGGVGNGYMPNPSGAGGGIAPQNTNGGGAPPGSPYASGFAGGSNDPNAFTQPSYAKNLNQNMDAWFSNVGQAPAFSQSQFDNAWNQYMTMGNFNPDAFNKAMGLGGSVTAQEQANPNSNLYQVPTVTPGQPYQHFMQQLNFGNGPVSNPGGPSNPYGYNMWAGDPNSAKTQAAAANNAPTSATYAGATGGAGGGAFGGFNPNGGGGFGPGQGGQGQGQGQGGQFLGQQPANQFGNGQFNTANTPGWNTGFNNPLAGGFNSWGSPLMGNPYSYMTGIPQNGLYGGRMYGGGCPGGPGGWVPSSGMGGMMAAMGMNPLMMGGGGGMGGFSGLLNNMMGINPFMMGGYQSPMYNIGAPNTYW